MLGSRIRSVSFFSQALLFRRPARAHDDFSVVTSLPRLEKSTTFDKNNLNQPTTSSRSDFDSYLSSSPTTVKPMPSISSSNSKRFEKSFLSSIRTLSLEYASTWSAASASYLHRTTSNSSRLLGNSIENISDSLKL